MSDKRLAALKHQVVDACNNIILLEGERMSAKRFTLQSAIDFITARRDQCWPDPSEDPPEPALKWVPTRDGLGWVCVEDTPEPSFEDLIGDDEDLIGDDEDLL